MHLRNSCTRSTSACCMRQVPSGMSGERGLNCLIVFLARKFQETSVTRSRITGKVCIGSRMTGMSRLRLLSRVIHMSFGMPLISAEQEPHLPALQFQRSARSGACCAWMRCTASKTTMPSSTGVTVILKRPPAESPRQMRNIACVAIGFPLSHSLLFHLLNHGLQLIGQGGRARFSTSISPSAPRLTMMLCLPHSHPCWENLREIARPGSLSAAARRG